MCYFVAEGYHHTRDIRKYTARMFLFAVISHFAYVFASADFAGWRSFIPFSSGRVLNQTSVMWSLAWGLVMLRVAGRVLPGCTAPGCRRAAGHLPGPVRLFRRLGRRTSGPGDCTDRKALPPVKSARRTRRIYPICFSPKYKTVSGRKSLISAGKPEFPVPGRLPERFFALQILFPAGFARFFWKKALQTNRKKLLYK